MTDTTSTQYLVFHAPQNGTYKIDVCDLGDDLRQCGYISTTNADAVLALRFDEVIDDQEKHCAILSMMRGSPLGALQVSYTL